MDAKVMFTAWACAVPVGGAGSRNESRSDRLYKASQGHTIYIYIGITALDADPVLPQAASQLQVNG